MAELYVQRGQGGVLIPMRDEDAEKIKAMPFGQPARMKYSFPRNAEFHKKFFAMLDVGYDAWEPQMVGYLTTTEQRALKAFCRWRGMDERLVDGFAQVYHRFRVNPVKDREQFRADVTILAGFYTATYRVDGSVQFKPKSISFANMGEEEFEKLYSSVANVLLEHVLTNYSQDDLDEQVNLILGFV